VSNTRAQNVALLTGVTILSALSANDAVAATTTQTQGFFADTYPPPSFGFGPDEVDFDPFDTSLGTLTGVTFDISGSVVNREASGIPTAKVTLGSTTLYEVSGDTFGFTVAAPFDGTASGLVPLSAFLGPGFVSITVAILSTEGDFDFGGGDAGGRGNWSEWGSGLKLTYTYTPADISTVPLPASVWLLGFGLAGLASVSWGRRHSA
jgi:hypothetical protein